MSQATGSNSTTRSDLACIVRVFQLHAPSEMSFLGTGMLVQPNRVLTCKHVVQEKQAFTGKPLSTIRSDLIVEDMDGHQIAVSEEVVVAANADLALLTLATPMNGEPLRFLSRLTKASESALRRAPLEVIGYGEDVKTRSPRQYSIGEISLVEAVSVQDPTLVQCQVSGGLPEGVSGSPMLLPLGTQWAYVGTAYLGGKGSATSRVILADSVVDFLTQEAGIPQPKQVDARWALSLPPGAPVDLENLIERSDNAQEPPPNPYRHLESFREIDAPYFHGREAETQALLTIVQQHPRTPFVALVGASGSGKSSLVQAGLIPALRGDPSWHIAMFRPGRDPFAELAGALAPFIYPDLDHIACRVKGNELARAFHAQSLSFTDVVATVAAQYPAKRLLLIVDQFEELYTHSLPDTLQQLFLEGLVALIGDPKLCTVMVTLRVDFLGQVMSFSPLVEVFNHYRQQFLNPMLEPAALRDAIEKPAQKWGVSLQPGLTDRILQDLGRAPGILPLLQFTLAELWLRQDHRQLTHAAYEAIGGVHKALSTYADRVIAHLNHQEEEKLRQIFIQLVGPGEGTEDTRQVATRIQVGDANWPLVRQLANARLLVTGSDEQGQETVEVVHEALIRHWPPLQQWMEQARVFRVWQNRLRQEIQDWKDSNRDDGVLLRGVRLAEAAEKLAQYAQDITSEERNYIEASAEHRDQELAAREKERRERQRLVHDKHVAQLFITMLFIGAGLIGGLTRMGLSQFFGSFLWVPIAGSTYWNAIVKPLFHGWFGTVIGGFFVFGILNGFPDTSENMPRRRIVWLAVTGIAWGTFISGLVTEVIAPEAQGLYDWDKARWGYLITGPCWGVGLALGIHAGDMINNKSSDILTIWRNRLLGAAFGSFVFLLVSPLIMAYWRAQTDPLTLLQTTWAALFSNQDSLSVGRLNRRLAVSRFLDSGFHNRAPGVLQDSNFRAVARILALQLRTTGFLITL